MLGSIANSTMRSASARWRARCSPTPAPAGMAGMLSLECCDSRCSVGFNIHSADGWEAVLKPVGARYQGKVSRIYFRADAGFANPEVYEYLEAERIKYAIRLPANRVLQERIGYLLQRPVGRPSNDLRRSYANFTYQAGSWNKPRRVVAKVEWHPGELYPRVGFMSPTCRDPPRMSSPSTTSAGRASNGSRREKAQSSGHGCHVGHSPPTRFVHSFMRWPTISAIFCARWRRRSRSRSHGEVATGALAE